MVHNKSLKKVGTFFKVKQVLVWADWQPCSMVPAINFSSATSFKLLWCFKAVKLVILITEVSISVQSNLWAVAVKVF